MTTLTTNFLYLLIYPFMDKRLFVWIGGILCTTWCLDTIFRLIRNDYY